MQFADPRATSTAYLILRHLYDGDIIEWPIGEDHPLREVFVGLEAQGYVARWDRIWPLSDRYRLTEKGIAAIEGVYHPAGAEALFDNMRQMNLSPNDRRAYLQSHGLNPMLWPFLHDPSTHWSTFHSTPSRYWAYVWEDQSPIKKRKRMKPPKVGGGGNIGRGNVVRVHHHHHHHHHPDPPVAPYLVDLDRQAEDTGGTAPTGPDLDVS